MRPVPPRSSGWVLHYREVVIEKKEMSRVLKVLNAIVTGGRDLKCESCGKDFVCGISLKGCWCSEIPLTGETRSSLRSKYKDCLCRECLEKQSALQNSEL